MKINEIQKILTDNWPKLNYRATNVAAGLVDLSGVNQIRSAIDEIEKTGIASAEVARLKDTVVFASFQDTMRITQHEVAAISPLLEQIKTLARNVSDALNIISVKHEANSVSIKLPGDVYDFGGLAKVCEDFQLLLSQIVVNAKINGEIKINGAENGSIWFEVCLGTSAALTLIGSLTWSAMVIYKKLQEGQIFHQHVESLKIKNDMLKEIQKAQKAQLDVLIEMEATNIRDTNFDSDDNEIIGRLSLSIKMLSELIYRGAEIHPALNTPETVANLFPDKNRLELVQSRIKQLSETNE